MAAKTTIQLKRTGDISAKTDTLAAGEAVFDTSTKKLHIATADSTQAKNAPAINAYCADTVTDSAITTAKIANKNVTAAKIADATITNAQIADDAGIAVSKINGLGSLATKSIVNLTYTAFEGTSFMSLYSFVTNSLGVFKIGFHNSSDDKWYVCPCFIEDISNFYSSSSYKTSTLKIYLPNGVTINGVTSETVTNSSTISSTKLAQYLRRLEVYIS